VVLVLMIVDVPLARLAHQSLNSSGGSSPVWFSAALAVVGSVVAWRKPGNPLGWLFLGGALLSVRQLPGHCEGTSDCITPLDDQDAARAASMLIPGTSGPGRPGAPAEHCP
jgi:hypothetical protein